MYIGLNDIQILDNEGAYNTYYNESRNLNDFTLTGTAQFQFPENGPEN